ncbi:MAG TPA: hypothetical protein VF677_13050 [Flavobacterium sp.]
MGYFNDNKYKDWELDKKYSSPNDKRYTKENYWARVLFYNGEYTEEIQNTTTPYTTYKYFHKNGILKTSVIRFYGFPTGISKEYDQSGKVIKQTDWDKDYKFSIEDLVKKMKEEYDVDIMNVSRISRVHRFVEKKELKIPLYEIWSREEINRIRLKCYLINGNTGEVLFINERFQGDKKGSLLQNYLDSSKNRKKISAIYITHKGKSYTEEEWKAFEQEHHNEYLRKNGREDEIKPVETPKTGNNNSSPGKKGAYENPQLGTPYTSPAELNVDKDIYQVYKGRYYTKAEWKEFHKSLPWWERLI